MTKCNQKQCCYLDTESCPVCDECRCEPNIVDHDCTSCWNCEHDAGILRGQPDSGISVDEKVKEKEKEKEKVIEVQND